jgi:pimeloyl-ACP methyl ester carboxylesterase
MNVTRYAKSGDLSIAYQLEGNGPLDLVVVPGIVSHVEAFHELPGYSRFIERLASFARVITFDKRGTGLSDRGADLPARDQQVPGGAHPVSTLGRAERRRPLSVVRTRRFARS